MTLQPLTAATHLGRRKYQEDRHFHIFHTLGLAIGVFDGHGGEACSHFCAENYPAILAAELDSGAPPQEALRVSFDKLNRQTQHLYPGSTASVAFIPWDASVAHVAVIGDSPILIKSGGGVWVAPEHNVRTNQAEAEAAKARGGFIYGGYLSASYSGNGLQMARALGDYELDRVLSRVPDIASVQLDAESWVLVATDGALDPSHVNEAEGILILKTLVDGGADAQAIVDRALAIPTHDNVTGAFSQGGVVGMLLKHKLKKCKHGNTNVYDYIRNDILIDDLVSSDDYNARRKIKGDLTGLRFCLDCGSTQRYLLSNPLNGEPWVAPWMWR